MLTPNSLVQTHDKLILVFSATWCGPCQKLKDNLGVIKAGIPSDIHIEIIDCDEHSDFAGQYSVKSIPTVAIFKQGELKQKITGVHPPHYYHEILETAFSDN